MIRINLLGDSLVQATGKKDKAEAAALVQSDAPARTSLPIIGIVVGLLLASGGLFYYLWMEREIHQLQEKVEKLQQEKQALAKYTTLEKQFRDQKEALQKKREVILNLKNAQRVPVYFLQELANALPDDVWFKEITQKGMNITIKGEGTSFESINMFRSRLLEQTKWFGNVNYPTASKKGGSVEFTISFDLKNPS
ncbi:MAG: PilN domain-containing protein [Firmicutes bacterium]|nr:PilN domain-containing protein [Bacillota bacterium]